MRWSKNYQSLDRVRAASEEAWYWRFLAFVASWIIVAGFVALVPLFDSDPQYRIGEPVIAVIAVALLTAGISLTALLCFACRSWVFRVQNVFLPCLSSTSLGFAIILLSFAVSKRYVWNVASILGVVISGASTIAYGLLVRIGRSHFDQQRQNQLQNQPLRSPQPSISSHWPLNYGQPTPTTMAPSIYDGEAPVETVQGRIPSPEEEMTRQQMLGLGWRAEHDRSARSSFSSLKNTYHIDLPPPNKAPTTYRIDFPSGSQSVRRPRDGSKLTEFYAPGNDADDSDLDTLAGNTLRPGGGPERTRSAPQPAATTDPVRARSREDRQREIELTSR